MQKGFFASLLLVCSTLAELASAASSCPVDCSQFSINPRMAAPTRAAAPLPPLNICAPQIGSAGLPIPDPACTPGASNPTVTLDVLTDPAFRTCCLRDRATSAGQKADTYDWYDTDHPVNNKGANQVCELDHVIPLELGGADTLDNIWPQCGPSRVGLQRRYFKLKDTVENYLTVLVCEGRMDLQLARQGIAVDWTQFLSAAINECGNGSCDPATACRQ